MDTAEILTKAAEVITARGWHIGGYQAPDSRAVCVVGAIGLAADLPFAVDTAGKANDSPQLHAARRAVGALEIWLGDRRDGFDLTYWNDRIAISATEVTTALRECATDLTNGAGTRTS